MKAIKIIERLLT